MTPLNYNSAEKFLFFATGDGMDAATDAVVYPLSSFKGISPASATTCKIYFTPAVITDVAASDVTDFVTVTFANGRFKEVAKDFFGAINNKFNIMVDDDNDEFFSIHVSDCAITLAA